MTRTGSPVSRQSGWTRPRFRPLAINLLIKKIKRVGHGFRNFDNYRLRLLLHYGTNWDTAAKRSSMAGGVAGSSTIARSAATPRSTRA